MSAYADWLFLVLVGVCGWLFRYEHHRISLLEQRIQHIEAHHLSREEFTGGMNAIRTELREQNALLRTDIAQLATAIFSLKGAHGPQ